ncbi:hypothetical protein JHD50_11580 [Sulfurimonas sp. MAG313]|nr:hypothetical protein [Sulfurimonas sp. MAG313]MDF1881929.1 hypothetical protein [Sulfurimonas sp. MAG313]
MAAYKALLTVDLSGTSPAQKAVFQESLKMETWQILGQMEASWRCSWNDTEYDTAVNAIKADVNKAALAAGLQRYPYAFQLGTNIVKSF